MNSIKHFLVGRAARTDARLGLDSSDDRVVAELGPRPKLDPVGNAEHSRIVSALGERVRIDELREDVVREEDGLAEHAPPIFLTLGLLAAVGVELLGALLVMKSLGVEPSERMPLGLALTLALIGLTAVTAHRSSSRGGRPEGGIVKRSLMTFVILVGYAIFITAITIVRIHGAADEETTPLEVVAHGMLMLATCLGPAWIAEWLIRKRAPSVALRKRLAMLRKRLRATERAHANASEYVTRISRDGARWDVEAARRHAQYATYHRLETAKEKT